MDVIEATGYDDYIYGGCSALRAYTMRNATKALEAAMAQQLPVRPSSLPLGMACVWVRVHNLNRFSVRVTFLKQSFSGDLARAVLNARFGPF